MIALRRPPMLRRINDTTGSPKPTLLPLCAFLRAFVVIVERCDGIAPGHHDFADITFMGMKARDKAAVLIFARLHDSDFLTAKQVIQ